MCPDASADPLSEERGETLVLTFFFFQKKGWLSCVSVLFSPLVHLRNSFCEAVDEGWRCCLGLGRGFLSVGMKSPFVACVDSSPSIADRTGEVSVSTSGENDGAILGGR